MDTLDLSAGIGSTMQTYLVNKNSTGTAVVGHNGHPIAAKLARLWIQQLKPYHPNVCYIELSAPSICRYARFMEQATHSYWLHVQQKDDVGIANLIIQRDEEEHIVPLWKGLSIQHQTICEPTSIESLSCKYAPTYITDYFEHVVKACTSINLIRRARIHVAVGFDNPFFARFVTRFLNTLGCKVFPLLGHVKEDELARTVHKRRLSFGIVFDEHLNIRMIVDEEGESITEITERFDKDGFFDGVLVVLRLLEWVSANQFPASHLTHLESGLAVPFTAENRFTFSASGHNEAQNRNVIKAK